MNGTVERYLRQATRGLKGGDRRQVQQELRADLERLIDEQRLAGLTETQAVQAALELYGDPGEAAVGFVQVHTLPRLKPVVPGALVFLAVASLVTIPRTSEAILVTMQGAKPACTDLPSPARHCLSERQGWVALSNVTGVLRQQGWTVTPTLATASDVPGVQEGVWRVERGDLSFDLPRGPEQLHRARLEARGLTLAPDATVFEREGETFVQATTLFGRLASLLNVPVAVEQRPGQSTLRLAGTEMTFAFTDTDPAEEVVWEAVGLALAHDFGLTVAAQREARDAPHGFEAQVQVPGTYALVFRHPQARGVGYVVARTDEAGRLKADLPAPARRVVASPGEAWRSPQTVSLLRFTGRLNGTRARLVDAAAVQ